MRLRVLHWEVEQDPETSVLFDAGIDHLVQFKPGMRFYVECEVIENTGARIVVQPRGVAPVDE